MKKENLFPHGYLGSNPSPGVFKMKKNINKPFIIGIAGISGSGKTTISKKLAKRLNAKLIHLDDYWRYHKATKIPSRKEWKKWEHASATNFNKALKEIVKLKNNKCIIIEGLHTFNNSNLRKLLDFKIYYSISSTFKIRAFYYR